MLAKVVCCWGRQGPTHINVVCKVQTDPIHFYLWHNASKNRCINIKCNSANSENELCYYIYSANRAPRQGQPYSNRSPKRRKNNNNKNTTQHNAYIILISITAVIWKMHLIYMHPESIDWFRQHNTIRQWIPHIDNAFRKGMTITSRWGMWFIEFSGIASSYNGWRKSKERVRLSASVIIWLLTSFFRDNKKDVETVFDFLWARYIFKHLDCSFMLWWWLQVSYIKSGVKIPRSTDKDRHCHYRN